MHYQPTIGLEIHIELKTRTKMFCGCLNNSDEKHPNINVCPVCLGHPGTLPTINKKAVESVLKLGLALNSEIPEISKFDRKNYFYPDLPKGYQISQYDKPLALSGELNSVKIRRIHLEEDTARLIHSPDGKSSLVDFNRAGVPLMELVTEPVIRNGEEAVAFAKELQLILRYLGISDADMEKGQMRVEANVSVSKDKELGTKVEIKNLNSFRAVEEAIDYEIKRQTEILEKGEKIRHETRGWDDNKKITVSQRVKEEAHDYRYFPEPDLPILILGTSDVLNIDDNNLGTSDVQRLKIIDLEKLKAEIPELPWQKRERFIKEYNFSKEQADILTDDFAMADYFEKAASELKVQLPEADYRLLYNYLVSDLRGLTKEVKIAIDEIKILPEQFANLIALTIKNSLSSRVVKDILKEMFERGVDPETVLKDRSYDKMIDEESLNKAIEETLKDNSKAVSDYKKGRGNALQFLVGQAMAQLKGRADPKIIEELIKKQL